MALTKLIFFCNQKSVMPLLIKMQLKIDFGELGVKKSSAQITDLYTQDDLLNKQILAIKIIFVFCMIFCKQKLDDSSLQSISVSGNSARKYL